MARLPKPDQVGATTYDEVAPIAATDLSLSDGSLSNQVVQPATYVDEDRLIEGQKGDKGDPGDPGPGGLYYVHDQTVAATVWTVNHNLGQQPGGVLVVDHLGEQIWGDISYVGVNTIVFTADDLVSGKMYLS